MSLVLMLLVDSVAGFNSLFCLILKQYHANLINRNRSIKSHVVCATAYMHQLREEHRDHPATGMCADEQRITPP